MPKEDIAPYLRNLALKREFERQGLDLDAVMEYTPLDLDLENRRLQNLLNFIDQYRKCGSQDIMETIANGYVFPPIFPLISPESDWYRFEQWMKGEIISKKLLDQLPEEISLRKPAEIDDDEIEKAIEQLIESLEKAGCGASLYDDIPARLVYTYLYEVLHETIEVFEPGGGFWFFDGCSGYCPGCFQRPWCEFGQSSCWNEDEQAGKMHLIEELSQYVCATPQSLAILQQLQAEQDAAVERFEAENPYPGMGLSQRDEEWRAKLN
jgi:hypothetical protein